MSESSETTQSAQTTVPASSPIPESQSLMSPAVSRCVDAYSRTYKTERARTREDYAATKCAKKAFRSALPPLVGHENIRDFIACIAQAMLMDVIDTPDASKLLYAAQVALAAVRAQPLCAKSRAA
ncbi:MAG: hypothetical protein WBQ95_19200 [Terracidiphilus sp.]